MVKGKRTKQVPENLRKQLAVTVRNLQWSYAIFWSISADKQGVLEWGDGYYNGDIKTRKTVQAVDLNADQLGLQRSDQLRELFQSLSVAETNLQAKKLTAALSPEDLTDAEWYFLVCMSFTFNVGQGLPGRSYSENRSIWLCNAHLADTKVFSRSLLSKSASIRTVVCFPHLGGVIELGATELVSEDPNLILQIKNSIPDLLSSKLHEVPNQNYNDLETEIPDHSDRVENDVDQFLDCPDVEVSSPDDSSNNLGANLVEGGIDVETSQIQSWQYVDEAISDGLNNSMNSSDCISQTYENPESIIQLSSETKETQNQVHQNQECEQQKLNSGPLSDDFHYQSVLTSLLRSSQQLILGPYFRNGNKESSFVSWKKDRLLSSQVPKVKTPQTLLKKVLFEVAKMHQRALESDRLKDKQGDPSKIEVEETDRNHVLSERKRREKINERFMILGSLIPSGGKVDKVSILDHTIEYVRDLERKVEELESHKQGTVLEPRTKSKPQYAAIEQTSDNYGPNKTFSRKKRKACDVDKAGIEISKPQPKDALIDDIIVNVTENDVLIEINCTWKESILLEIMESLSKQNLHPQSVQTSNTNGVLSLTIEAKCKGLKSSSACAIKLSLQKVFNKS